MTHLFQASSHHRYRLKGLFAARLSPRVVLLVGAVLTGSLLDAYLTIRYVQQGGGEANPLMAWALAQSYTLFVSLKMGLTGLGVWLLAAYHQVPLAYKALHGLALAYGVLSVYYVVLFW
jgi:formate hydrogenlyase subunit 3/multisubunit Na+/H+ antiporter MnhD subunit